jgi:hypothetical protein
MVVNPGDEWTERLARLFRDHLAWREAAAYLRSDASSTVYFTHRPGEVWRLEDVAGETRLVPGAASDPDLVFRFSPQSIERLEGVEGRMGDFAVALFSLIVDDEVRLRIISRFLRLARRGYVKLLLAGGPQVIAFGVTHGIRTLPALRRLVAETRSSEPADWET